MLSNNVIDAYHSRRHKYISQVWGFWQQLSWAACFAIIVILCFTNPDTPGGYHLVRGIGFFGIVLFVLTVAFNLYVHRSSPPLSSRTWHLDEAELIFVSERNVALLDEVLEAVNSADPESLACVLLRIKNDAPELLEFELILDLQRHGVETLVFHSSQERR